MEANENTIKLYYNTEVEKLAMPEYGRNILKMVEIMKGIEDRAKRSEQARAIVKVMETLNPQVHQQENFEQKLWDHLYMIAGYDLDIDAPYPAPVPDGRCWISMCSMTVIIRRWIFARWRPVGEA